MLQAVQNEKNTYLNNFSEFQQIRGGRDPQWLNILREEAIGRFLEAGFPTPRDEEWKYTDVSPIARRQFALPGAGPGLLGRKESAGLRFSSLKTPFRIVFVNGGFSPGLSNLNLDPNGLIVTTLEEALDRFPNLVQEHLGRYADIRENPFSALNMAFAQAGAFVRVPKGKVIEDPVHILSINSTPDVILQPRNLIVAESSSQIRVVETYLGRTPSEYFTNAVTEVVALDNAIVDHYKVEHEGPEAFHIATLWLHQGRDCSVRTASVSMGGALIRNNLDSVLDGPGGESSLNGLFLKEGQQHVDNHTRLVHAKPHCDSRELYKGILTDRATGVFHGRIVVKPGAQKTDSKQTNNNLLLSNEALINTKPQLEIYADDVKCTHGATIGQLDADALFYLRSRGIGDQAARSLLIYAFATEVIEKIRVEELRRQLDDYLFGWLPKGEWVREAV